MVRRPTILVLTVLAVVCAWPATAVAQDGFRDRLADELVEVALGAEAPPPGRALFEAVLASDEFLHEAVGQLDVYVHRADGLAKSSKARKELERAAEGLEPVARSLEAWFADGEVVGGRRFPVVLTHSDREDGEVAFDSVLALLDRCEDGGYSGFKPDLPVFSGDNLRRAEVATWEVLVCNLAHDDVREQGRAWLEHGLGYSVINLVVNRLFARGSWGPPPPWLKDGLVDELDIASYGEAWVAAGTSVQYASRTAGWQRDGWSGFVPKGTSPPPPVFGPPPGLPTRVQASVASDKWLDRRDSATRHWSALSRDLDADVPVSFRNMAAGRSFENRDRAYARCVLSLLTGLRSDAGTIPLLASLDAEESRIGKGGVRTAEPLPVLVARSMGGVSGVDEIEALTMREFLERIDRRDLIETVEALGGGGMLGIADHRQQSAWLYHQPLDGRAHQKLYLLLLEVENFQQLQEWEVIGDALDAAAHAALATTRRFPERERDREEVLAAFTAALDGRR